MDSAARERINRAIADFWGVRAAQQASATNLQGGTRSSVTGGQHLNAVRDLLGEVFISAGFSPSEVHTSGRAKSLPGYFRPTKNWDIAVTSGVDIVALIELKSQVGSFGNNANNRSEESLGNPVDLDWAFRNGLLGPRPPWVGYVYVIEDCPDTTRPVRETRTFYAPDPIFNGASYLDRFAILAERVVAEGIYDAAWIVATSSPTSPAGVTWREPRSSAGFERFQQAVTDLYTGRVAPGPHVVIDGGQTASTPPPQRSVFPSFTR